MRYLFIINPVAGTTNKESITAKITEYAKALGIDYRIIRTVAPGDAEKIARREAEAASDEITIFSCGGDGTLNEVVNGVWGHENVTIGIMPIGSGNDFVRVFRANSDVYKAKQESSVDSNEQSEGESSRRLSYIVDAGKNIEPSLHPFLDLYAQVNGNTATIDLLKVNNRLAINLANVGLDAVVARNMTKFRAWGRVHKELPYSMGVLLAVLGPLNRKVELAIDDEPFRTVKMTILVAGNGSYYGGGYYATPEAILDDGLLDMSLIGSLNHFELPKLLSLYKQGEHLKHPAFNGRLMYGKCRKWQVRSKRPLTYACDGETTTAKEVTVSVIPKAVRILVPQGLG